MKGRKCGGRVTARGRYNYRKDLAARRPAGSYMQRSWRRRRNTARARANHAARSCSAATGHYVLTGAHVANTAHREGKMVRWDVEGQKIV